MKLELTQRKSIDELIEEYYYMDSHQKDKVITRRDFLKVSAVSSAVLAFPFLTQEAEANPLIYWGIMALLSGAAVASGENIEWEFWVKNESKKPRKDEINFKLKDRYSLDTMDKASKKFYIPERTMDVYTASGLSAEVRQKTEAFISTYSRRKEQRTDYFNIG
jgi:hypothetical protein